MKNLVELVEDLRCKKAYLFIEIVGLVLVLVALAIASIDGPISCVLIAIGMVVFVVGALLES